MTKPKTDDNASVHKNQRQVRSFVRRLGRMTPAQQRAIEQHWQAYGIDLISQSRLDLDKLFQRKAPYILEIGFGMGQSLLQQAKDHPENNYLGIEVHKPGVGCLLAAIHAENLTNIRVCCADAVDVLTQHIADDVLDKIQIFFPDPWPKKRHHKRRLIQNSFVDILAKKLRPGGVLHIATDWQEYAEHILSVLNAHPVFINQAPDGKYVPRPKDRPLTKFESRGQKLGHGVWDVVVKKA
jgi:tRNA (guanine-N7-)-methyltransferase